MKRKNVGWLSGCLLLAAAFAVSFIITDRDSIRHFGVYFVGQTNGISVSVAIVADPNDCEAWVVEMETVSSPIHFYGAKRESDGTLFFECAKDSERVQLRVNASRPQAAEIFLQRADAPEVLAVVARLDKIADRFCARRRGGFRLFGYGARATHDSSFPQFVGNSELEREVNRRLREWCRGHSREFARVDGAEMRDAILNRTASWDYECLAHWIPLLKTDRIVSLVALHYEFTGCAHGNSWFETMTLARDGDDVKELQLSDLFAPDSGWEAELARLCVEQLNAQGASSIVSGDIQGFKPDELTFAMDAGGLIFFFAPYAVGCYAEGAYVVRVPFSEIQSPFRNGSVAVRQQTP